MGRQRRKTVKKKCPSTRHQNKKQKVNNDCTLDVIRVCANCCSPIDSSSTRKTHEIPPKNSSQKQPATYANNNDSEDGPPSDYSDDLNEMISTIYNLDFIPLLVQKYPDEVCQVTLIEAATDLPLCFLCTNLLKSFFLLYSQFNQIRKTESLLSKLINYLNSLINYDHRQNLSQQLNQSNQADDDDDAEPRETSSSDSSLMTRDKINPQDTTTTIATTATSTSSSSEFHSINPEPCVWVEIERLDDLTVEEIGYAPPSLRHLYQEAPQGTLNGQGTTPSCHSTENKLEFSSNVPGSWVKVGSRLEDLTSEKSCSSLTLDPNLVQEPLQSTIEFSEVFSIPSVVQVDTDHEMDSEPSPMSDPGVDDDEDVKPHGTYIKPEFERDLDSESTNISVDSANKSSTLENSTPTNESERNEPALDEEEKSNVEENEKEPQQKVQSEQDLSKRPCTAVVETGQTENLEKRQLRVRIVPLVVVNTSQASIPPVQNDDDDDDDIDQVNDNDDDMDYEPSFSSNDEDDDDDDDEISKKLDSVPNEDEDVKDDGSDIKPDLRPDSEPSSEETATTDAHARSVVEPPSKAVKHVQVPKKEYKRRQTLTPCPCLYCQEDFQNPEDRATHVRKHHFEGRKFLCRTCGTTFLLQQAFDYHKNGTAKKCSAFLDKFAPPEMKKNKIKQLKGKKEYPCTFVIKETGQVCPYRAKLTYGLKLHMMSKHAEEKDKVKCGECGKVVKSKLRLKDHFRSMHSEESRKAYQRTLEKLRERTRARRKEQNVKGGFSCPHCGLDFRFKASCAEHLRTIHNDNSEVEKFYACILCGRKFKKSAHLQKHMQCVHSDARPFACDECGRRYKVKQMLQDHVYKTHNEEGRRKNLARQAAKYRERKLLRQEEARKAGIDGTVCRHCGIDFITRNKCTMHRRSVHDDYTGAHNKVLICELCGKKFDGPSPLKAHKQHVHSDARPFICELCGDSFKASGDLHNHKRFHTDEGKKKHNEWQRANTKRKRLIREQKEKKEADEMEAETETSESDSESDNESEQVRETAVVTRSSTSAISSTLPPQPTHNT